MEIKLVLEPGAVFKSIGILWDDGSEGDGESLECVGSILINVCQCLAETTETRFSITGFNFPTIIDASPYTVYPEFCIFLEHLPASIFATEKSSPFEIEFYEQGYEYTLAFTPIEGAYSVSCFKGYAKVLVGTPDIVGQGELLTTFRGIRDDLLNYLNREAPMIENHPWIVDYFNGIGDVWDFRE